MIDTIQYYITRWTGWIYHDPTSFIEDVPDDFDFEHWYEYEYTYQADPIHGLLDHGKRVDETLEHNTGDCVDVSVLAMSMLAADNRDVYIGMSYTDLSNTRVVKHIPLLRSISIPRHMVVSDGQLVYDSRLGVSDSIRDYIEYNGKYDNIRLTKIQ